MGSLNLGSPIMFRDLEVGEILGWDVSEMARKITIHAFVREPFDKYIHDNSRFWNASGANFQFGTNGLEVQVELLRAVVLGGVAFETPDDPHARRKAKPTTRSSCSIPRMRPRARPSSAASRSSQSSPVPSPA